jgi:hypothetical protein
MTDYKQRSSFREQQFFSLSRNFPHFVEPGGSLPYSQEPATCSCPDLDESSLRLLIWFL